MAPAAPAEAWDVELAGALLHCVDLLLRFDSGEHQSVARHGANSHDGGERRVGRNAARGGLARDVEHSVYRPLTGRPVPRVECQPCERQRKSTHRLRELSPVVRLSGQGSTGERLVVVRVDDRDRDTGLPRDGSGDRAVEELDA